MSNWNHPSFIRQQAAKVMDVLVEENTWTESRTGLFSQEGELMFTLPVAGYSQAGLEELKRRFHLTSNTVTVEVSVKLK